MYIYYAYMIQFPLLGFDIIMSDIRHSHIYVDLLKYLVTEQKGNNILEQMLKSSKNTT